MLNKLLANKKVVITVLVLLVVVCVGAVLLITSRTKETGGKDTDIKTEQSKEDDITQDNHGDTNNESGLQVLKPDETVPENSTDASGSWDNTTDSETQGDSTNTTNDDSDKQVEQESEDDEDEDILEDDITWGNIY